jgi:hypothetical protein
MDKEKKTTSGAPSSDTTSALFVSARKKQLEQQEEERRAKEKEQERLAAEAEVRRLEAEVEERRRKAEEDVRRVEWEAAEKRRLAEQEARAQSMQEVRAQNMYAPAPVIVHQPAVPVKAKGNKKMFILGIAAGVVLLVVLFIVLALIVGSDEPDISFDIYGSYYLDGNTSQVEIYLDSDGSFYAADLNESISGEWYSAGDQLYITVDGETETARILDEDTLDFGENGTFLRIIAGSDPGDLEWYPDENAEFDSMVSSTSMALGVTYPSSQFYIEEQTADGFTLKSQDDQAYINYNKIRAIVTSTHDERSSVQDALLIAMADSLPDAVVIDNVYVDSESRGYFAFSYEQDGETRYMYVAVQGWNNLIDGSKWYYAGLVDCPDSQSDVYSALFGRVHKSRFDS